MDGVFALGGMMWLRMPMLLPMLLPLLVLLWFRFIIADKLDLDDDAVVDTAAPVAAADGDLDGALTRVLSNKLNPSFVHSGCSRGECNNRRVQ